MDELGLTINTLPQKGLVEKGKKSRGGKQRKNDATLHFSWLLMALRFVTLLWCEDPKNLVALKTQQTFLACVESIVLQMLKL